MYKPRFKGTHYDAGLHYGKLLRLKGVKLESLLKFTDEQVHMGTESLKICQEVYPEIMDEIKGMAKGLNLDETLFGIFIITIGAYDSSIGCTTFCYKSENDLYFVRNHDMFTTLKKVTEAAVYRLESAHYFLAHGDGLIGKEDGINEHGLAVGINFVSSKVRKPGLNFFIMVRMILEKCATVQEAILLLQKTPSLTAHNIMLLDRTGDMAVVEMCSEKVSIRRPEGRPYMVSTNHFNCEDLKQYDHRPEENWYYTKDRYSTVERLLQDSVQKDRTFGIDLAKGQHGFVCQYEKELGFDTLWSVSYQLRDLSIARAEGNPSRVKYKFDTRLKWAMSKR